VVVRGIAGQCNRTAERSRLFRIKCQTEGCTLTCSKRERQTQISKREAGTRDAATREGDGGSPGVSEAGWGDTRKWPENGPRTRQNRQGFLATPLNEPKLTFASVFTPRVSTHDQ
jgi:hypothetical protein